MQWSARPRIFLAVSIGMLIGGSCSPESETPQPVEPKQNVTQVPPEQNVAPGRLIVVKEWAVDKVTPAAGTTRLITTRYEAEEGPVNVTATMYQKSGDGTLQAFATRAFLDGENTRLGTVETTRDDNTVAFTVNFTVTPGSPVLMTFCIEVNSSVQPGSVHVVSLVEVVSNATTTIGLPIEQSITVVP